MEMKEYTKWFDRKFEFDLPADEYESVLQRLMETLVRIKEIVKNVPAANLIKRDGNKWSVQEHIGHLIILEELHSARIDDFINGSEVLSAADLQNKKTYDTDFNNKNLQEILAELEIVRKKFVNRLEIIDEEVKLRTGIHPRLKQLMRPIDMAYFVAEHDDHHINLIIALIDKLFKN